ncbi:voltage gated chloride channel [Colletotrichum tofieldiae]|nr:voltage gated chloride channel [Colletotrichum tofieldiae]
MSSTSVDFSRYIDTTPVTAHPRLPLETVMELFRKIGPRVVLVEYHGRLSGLVTVKDCLKYQFTAEHAENPRDDSALAESQEKLWSAMRRAADWVSDKVSMASGGRVRLSSFDERRGMAGSGGGGGGGRPTGAQILDGDEDDVDDGAVELENR